MALSRRRSVRHRIGEGQPLLFGRPTKIHQGFGQPEDTDHQRKENSRRSASPSNSNSVRDSPWAGLIEALVKWQVCGVSIFGVAFLACGVSGAGSETKTIELKLTSLEANVSGSRIVLRRSPQYCAF